MRDQRARITPAKGDALVIVDVQKDFLPGGSLAVPSGGEVIPVLNGYIEMFGRAGLPIYATRDWHPSNHCSFQEQGGSWPVHCVAESPGAQFALELRVPSDAVVISKGTRAEKEAYSGFEGTDLEAHLRSAGVQRLFIGGLATDYCVLNTVNDALALGFAVFLLSDAIRAVNVAPEDGAKAERSMRERGVVPLSLRDFAGRANV